ncbi:MAG: galactonate dehydratase [Planctomycetes bacterium]|nr:galactonate dehydratase [Planctomycetota bacterium]
MKITAIRTYIVGEVRNFFFVVVETDEGICGLGEGGISWREQAMAGFIEALTPSLIGQNPMRTEHLWQLMYRCGFFPAGGVGAAAISAIDIALWDIKAKKLGVPVYELLGGLVRDRVVCYPHVPDGTIAEVVSAAKVKANEGWRFVRFNLPQQGQHLDRRAAVREGVELVTAVREAVGPEIEIILDAHTRLDPVDAITLCRELEPLRPYFVEDPIRCENASSLARLDAKTTVPIAMGEQYASKWEFREAIENEWIDYARIDLCNVGGFTEAIKVAHWCETHSINVAPHNPLGPVSTAACLHLDLAISNFAVQEVARVPGEVLTELFPKQVSFEAGYLLPPTAPGLGVEMDEAAVADYPIFKGGDCPRLTRPDGSFTNW